MEKVFENDVEQMIFTKTLHTINKYVDQVESEVVVSFSGGKDSTILLDICRRFINSEFKGVFLNTGIEYPQIVNFVKKFDNIEVTKPKLSFFQIIKKYGLPIISKEQSKYISDVRNPGICENNRKQRLEGKNFSISKKWRYLIDSDIKISNSCCYHLKKSPLKSFAKKNNYKYLTGERSSESSLRKQRYHTCILKDKCIPLRLWTDSMIEKYIAFFNIELSEIYKIERRTGCMYCMYGYQFEEKGNTRFDRMKKHLPRFYETAQKTFNIDKILLLIDIGSIKLIKGKEYSIKVDNSIVTAKLINKEYSNSQCEFKLKNGKNVIVKKTEIINKI